MGRLPLSGRASLFVDSRLPGLSSKGRWGLCGCVIGDLASSRPSWQEVSLNKEAEVATQAGDSLRGRFVLWLN